MNYLIKACQGLIAINANAVSFHPDEGSRHYMKGIISSTGETIYSEVCDLIIETKDARFRVCECSRIDNLMDDITHYLSNHKEGDAVEIDLYDPLGNEACYDNWEIKIEHFS